MPTHNRPQLVIFQLSEVQELVESEELVGLRPRSNRVTPSAHRLATADAQGLLLSRAQNTSLFCTADMQALPESFEGSMRSLWRVVSKSPMGVERQEVWPRGRVFQTHTAKALTSMDLRIHGRLGARVSWVSGNPDHRNHSGFSFTLGFWFLSSRGVVSLFR